MTSLTGLSPNNPSKYVGPHVALNTVVTRNRAPTGADYRQPETGKLYPFNTFWLVGKDPTTGTQGDLWYLSKIVSNVAYWIMLSGGAIGPMLSITVPNGVTPIQPDGTGNVNFTSTGGTVTITGSSANPNNHTINFDLTGGGNAIESITVQAATSPGLVSVTPLIGVVTVNAAAVANHSVPIETRSRALHAYNVEAQYATSAASTDATKSGLAHFNSAQFIVDANGFVSNISAPGIQFSNLGISYSAGTFTVTSADGTALSATNPASIWLQDRSNPGRLKEYIVTANQTFTDGSGGTTATMRWNLTASVNALVDIPFYLYAIGNDAQDTIAFMISRVPHASNSPASTSIGKSGAIVNVGQGDFFSLANVTVTSYDLNPCVVVGSFRMQFTGATNSWTVQTLTTLDGINLFQEGKDFIVPRGQFGAASGKWCANNGGTAPDQTNGSYVYQIYKSGLVNAQFTWVSIDVSGVGAVQTKIISPFRRLDGIQNCYGYWVGAGGSPGSITVGQFNPGVDTFSSIYITGSNVSSNLTNDVMTATAAYIFQSTIQAALS